MNHIHRIRRTTWILAALASALLAVGTAAPAFAAGLRPPPGSLHSPPLPAGHVTGPVHPVHTVVVSGMPGWQIALIAVGAALVAATVAVLVDRAWTARRQLATRSV